MGGGVRVQRRAVGTFISEPCRRGQYDVFFVCFLFLPVFPARRRRRRRRRYNVYDYHQQTRRRFVFKSSTCPCRHNRYACANQHRESVCGLPASEKNLSEEELLERRGGAATTAILKKNSTVFKRFPMKFLVRQLREEERRKNERRPCTAIITVLFASS